MSGNEYQAPDQEGGAASGGTPIVLILGLVLCLALGLIGILNTCFSGFAVITTQLAGGALAASPEQARVMEDIRAQQGWWVLPVSLLQLLLKMGLSAGLAVGSGLCLGRNATGASILKPTLVFGIVFELGVAIIGMANTAWNWETMASQFGGAMAADPALNSDIAQSAGTMFGVMMVVTMGFMFLWAAIKAGIYALTWNKLGSEEGYEYLGVFDD